MGTFSIKGAVSVSSVSAPTTPSWGGGTSSADPARPTDNASLLAGINSLVQFNPSLYCGWVSGTVGFHPGTWLARFGFNLSSNLIALDGNPAISWNSLPSGARALTAQLRIKVLGGPLWGLDPGSTLFFQTNVLTESANLGPVVSSTTPVIKTFNYPASGLSFLNIILDGFGIKFVTTLGGAEGQTFFAIEITGTYDIQTFISTLDGVHIPPSEAMNPRSFTMGGGGSGLGHVPPGSIIKPTQIPPGGISPGYDFPPVINIGTYISSANMNVIGNIKPGDLIRITTSDPNLDLTKVVTDDGTGVSGIALTYTDGLGVKQFFYILTIYIFYQSPTLILFQVPPYVELVFEDDPAIPNYPHPTVIPRINIIGTTFSGSVDLAPIIITMANASGIYFLSVNKTNDTLYDNINAPDTTDVKIPDPFIKTGFIGG